MKDSISRCELFNRLAVIAAPPEANKFKAEIYSVIQNMPVAKRPEAEWIGEADGYSEGNLVYDRWYCSHCDYLVESDEPPTYKFCPECGYKIKSKTKEEADDENSTGRV